MLLTEAMPVGSFTTTMFLVGWRHSRDATPTKASTTLRLFGSSQLERLAGERARERM